MLGDYILYSYDLSEKALILQREILTLIAVGAKRVNNGRTFRVKTVLWLLYINPLRPNSDLSQTSHCNIKSLSVIEVMRIANMITQVKSY